eukprot:1145769-Pelagomonas_calceolata.AAC.3
MVYTSPTAASRASVDGGSAAQPPQQQQQQPQQQQPVQAAQGGMVLAPSADVYCQVSAAACACAFPHGSSTSTSNRRHLLLGWLCIRQWACMHVNSLSTLTCSLGMSMQTHWACKLCAFTARYAMH